MIQITDFHDPLSITAITAMEDRLHAAIHEARLAEAHSGQRHRRAYIAGIGHLLVRLGAWLQAIAIQPAMMEETVQ